MNKPVHTDIDSEYFIGCNPSLARAAYENLSFTPEKRAASEIKDTTADLISIFNHMAEMVGTEDERERAIDAFKQFAGKYRSKYNAYLHAKSNCVSWMITGRSGLNVNRVNKANEREHRLLGLFIEWRAKAIKGMFKGVFGAYATSGVIMSDNPDALSLLRAKLDGLENKQEFMKLTNKAFAKFDKNKNLAEFFEQQGIDSDKTKKDILYYIQNHGKPFPQYKLANNNATIKSTKERITKLENYQSLETKEIKIGDIVIVQNTEIMRLQIFFPSKPCAKTIQALKSHGFRWSPTQGAWQRQDSNNAQYWANEIARGENSDETT